MKDIWSKLHKQISSNFIPSNMDRSLCDYNGERISLLGIIALEQDLQILKSINKIGMAIRQIILADSSIEKISVESIAKKSKLSESKVSFYLGLLNDYGEFYRGASYLDTNDSARINSIDVSGTDAIFYTYIHFTSIEDLILLKVNKSRPIQKELFLPVEQIELSNRLDAMLSDLETLKNGHEIIWTDMKEQMDELKTLFHLGKKSWYQLARAKFAEMFAGGIVSSLFSNPFSAQIEPLIKELMN
jgi:hypothetical protein